MKRFGLLIVLVTAALIAPLFGAESLTWSSLLDPTTPDFEIFFQLRLPRILLAGIVGGALSVLGVTYQTLFQNPLSEPYVLGVSSGATLGIVIAEMVLGVSAFTWTSGLFGAVGGFAVTFFLLLFSHSRFGMRSERLLLFGIGMNFFLSSVLFIILSFQLQSSSQNFRFLFGQIPWISTKETLSIWAAIIPVMIFLWVFGRQLDALSFGDATAKTLGVEPRRVRGLLLTAASLVLCILVIFTGSIGFVGLAIPHVVRIALKPQSTRQLFEASFVAGAIFLIAADIISRVLLPPYEFPVGTITTLLGGPIFIGMLWKR